VGECPMRRSLMLLLLAIAAGCGAKAAKDDPTGDALATGRMVPVTGPVTVDPGAGRFASPFSGAWARRPRS
jgi:hypothetical protein